MTIRWVCVATVVAACLGCDDSPGSCTIVEGPAGECVDYASGYVRAGVAMACTAPDGSTAMESFSPSPCTSTGRLGSCVLTTHGMTSTENYYSGDAATWMTLCQSRGGTWSAN